MGVAGRTRGARLVRRILLILTVVDSDDSLSQLLSESAFPRALCNMNAFGHLPSSLHDTNIGAILAPDLNTGGAARSSTTPRLDCQNLQNTAVRLVPRHLHSGKRWLLYSGLLFGPLETGRCRGPPRKSRRRQTHL
jgi:hypothetical protein